MILIVIITVATAILVGLHVYRSEQNKIKYEKPVYLENLQSIQQFLKEINSLTDYLTWIQRDDIKEKYAVMGKFFKNKSEYYKEEENVQKFNQIYQDFDNWTLEYNKNYVSIQKEKLNDYFDNIEGKKLDDQQRTAVITDEYSNQIVAGAGSGKTLTILAKVQYLIEQKNINPDNILLLSFTQKTVEELNERLTNINLKTRATTFHKLGYDIIKSNQSIIPAVTNENTINHIIAEYFKKDILNNEEALKAYIQYVACFMNIPEELSENNSLGDKIDAEKGINLQTLKSKCDTDNKVKSATLNALQGERVKSVEELTIANFLYLNSIKYEYEKPYPYGDHQYRPDFYLTDYDIWLEHFGVDRFNRTPHLTAYNEEKYVNEMELKRQNHKDNNTKLLETYSYYNTEKVLLVKLQQMLENEGVVLKERDTTTIFKKLAENEQVFGNELYSLIATFINLSKSRRLNPEAISELFDNYDGKLSEFMRDRQALFLQFALPIVDKYDEVLASRQEIDFNDMINLATDLIVLNNKTYNYDYIIVDEYQDISVARFNLIKEIRDRAKARLICVGDDWQSIYRFAGSDISLFSNFEKYIGKYEQLLIEQTYRNSQHLINISSYFIKKNPKQIDKKPKSQKPLLEDPITIVNYNDDDLVSIFINQIQYLVHKYGNKSILVVGRHSFDLNELLKLSTNNTITFNSKTGQLFVKGFEDVDIKFLTVHKSKGTEADNVIVLNLKNHLLGFPNKVTDDPIVSKLLSDSDNFKFAEERRLFYVALTRTKNEVHLLVPSEPSAFSEELIKVNNILTNGQNVESNTNCTYCRTGKLVIKTNPNNSRKFLGCSHYPVCNQTFNNIEILKEKHLCPSCKSGFMVHRDGKFGDFLGCTNYPKCSKTIHLNSDSQKIEQRS